MPSASVPPPAAEVLPAEREFDPDLWLRVLSWSVVAFSLVQILLFSFGRDQGIYAVVGSGILDGQMPYRDLWDFQPPGIFFVYASAFAVFGSSMIAPRLVEALCLFAIVLGCRRLGGVLFQSRTAGLMGGALAALLHAQLEFWHTGQPETFAGAFTMAALVLTTHEWPRRRAGLALLAVGLMFGAALLLQAPLALPALVCAAYVGLQRRRSGSTLGGQLAPLLWITTGSLVPVALCGLWFFARGALPDLLWALGEFAPSYTKSSWAGHTPWELFGRALFESSRFSALLTTGVLVSCVFLWRARDLRAAHALLFGVAAAQLAAVALQGKFLQHHYAAALPVLSVSAGVGLYRVWRRVGVGSVLGAPAFALLLGALTALRLPVRDVPLGFWQRSVMRCSFLLSGGRTLSRDELERELSFLADYNLHADRLLAAEVTRRVPRERSLYLWGSEPVVYWLSGRRPASRYIYNLPQRALWHAPHSRRLLLADLERDPPAAIVVQHADAIPIVTGNNLGSRDSLALFPELEGFVLRDYEYTGRIEDFDFHEGVRQSPSPRKRPEH